MRLYQRTSRCKRRLTARLTCMCAGHVVLLGGDLPAVLQRCRREDLRSGISGAEERAKGQGRRREAGSEGSPTRKCGAMDKNRI